MKLVSVVNMTAGSTLGTRVAELLPDAELSDGAACGDTVALQSLIQGIFTKNGILEFKNN